MMSPVEGYTLVQGAARRALPLYDPKVDDAPNYGDTGVIIGHELTPGFDDEGGSSTQKGI
jgi:predicted metalloendopeptidase